MTNSSSNDPIIVQGAHENNLQNLNVTIPKNQIVAFAGVSGSGKSSLVFDTLANESQRQWQESYSQYVKNKLPHYSRPLVDQIKNLTPTIVISQKALGQNLRSTVGTAVDVAPLLRLLFSRVGKPSAGGSMAYSANHPAGTCPDCTGLGEVKTLNEDSLFNPELSINEGAILFSQFSSGWQHYLYNSHPELNADKKLKYFSKSEWEILKYGTETNPKIEIRSNNTGRVDRVDYEGVIPRFKRLYLNRDTSKFKKSLRNDIEEHITSKMCPTCNGSGLNAKAIASKINGYNIVELNQLPIGELIVQLQKLDEPISQSITKQIVRTLIKMQEIGLDYLSLDRSTGTLSGGELQRLKIVKNLGGTLNNITYIFDEPTAGLHPRDIEKINLMLANLRDQKNNVLVVEHARQVLNQADYLIELGPGAGNHGGQIVFEGSRTALDYTDTLTAKYLNKKLILNSNPKAWTNSFQLEHVNYHNIKDVSVEIPKGILTAVTGVAGSGKSSLIREAFVKKYPRSILIDQKPIGTSSRSNPATYTGIMDEIRKLFAKANGVTASWFSFNSKGACPICKGTGKIKYDMAFADPVEVVCEECQGRRFNPTALSYLYHGKTIEEALNLTIEKALDFFKSSKITSALEKISAVGLEYLTLGQPTSTLSGGENQRLKIASELNQTGNIYVFDEPSSGLHPRDIDTLTVLFKKLVNQQNTVIIIDHRLQLIAEADWIIDLGPGGGNRGGNICFTGTPSALIKSEQSLTGKYLKQATKGV